MSHVQKFRRAAFPMTHAINKTMTSDENDTMSACLNKSSTDNQFLSILVMNENDLSIDYGLVTSASEGQRE